jgi:RNA polymerase sigma factor (sigma-70 family)
MQNPNEYLGDPAILGLVRKKARAMKRNTAGPLDSPDDLEQELMMALVKAFQKYDPTRCRHVLAFILVVLNRAAGRIEENRNAVKRTPTAPTAGNPRRPQSAEEKEQRERDRIELSVDIDSLLSQLRDEERELAELLQSMSLSEAARRLGKPRSSLQHRVGRIRRAFGDNNLEDYL